MTVTARVGSYMRLLARLRARFGAATTAIVAGVCFQSIYHQPVNALTSAVLTALALASAWSPLNGLLFLAGLGPIAALLAIVIHAPSSLHIGEAMTLAFLTGAAAHYALARHHDGRLDARIASAAALLVMAALTSGLVRVAVLVTEQPVLFASGWFPASLFNDYLIQSDELTAAMQFAEGPLLAVFAALACGTTRTAPRRVLRIVVVAGCGVAAINVVRVLMVWLQQHRDLVELMLNVRVNVQYSDLNAAGSYFAMITVFTLGFLDRHRLWAVPAVLLTASGLWLSGSRTALAAAVLTVVATAVYRMRGRTTRENARIAAGLAMLLVAALALWSVYPHYRNDRPWRALSMRIELAKAGLKMTADHPMFGVGLGRFRPLSREYLTGAAGIVEGENAHNQFIQIAAELGVPALLLTLYLIVMSLVASFRATADGVRRWALPAGIVTFLVTGLTGHPLLVPDAAYPLWLALGLAASYMNTDEAAAARTGPSAIAARAAVVAIAFVFIVPLPVRVRSAIKRADMESTSVGLSKWQRSGDDMRWRWAGGQATFFVDATARSVGIPLRLPADSPPREVRIFVDGREANRIRLSPSDSWRVVRFIVARRAAVFLRIDVEVTDGDGVPISVTATQLSGAVMIAQPILVYEH
jgi:hypothetical protein